MRVLIVNTVSSSGSTGRICRDMYNTLSERGCDVTVAFGRGDAPADMRVYKIGSPLGVAWHGAASRTTDRQGFYSAAATRKFIAFIKEYRPDIIQLHNLHGYYLDIDIFFKYLAECGIPVVYTLHDCWQFTGHCAYFDACGCDKWQNVCCNCPQKGKYPKSLLADNSRRNFIQKKSLMNKLTNIVFVSPSYWLKGLVLKSFIQSSRCEVIPNGIDLSVFKPTDHAGFTYLRRGGEKLILSAANIWEERKGLADMLRLAGLLGRGYRLVLAGVSEKQEKQLPREIVCISHIDSAAEMAALYSAADVFVSASMEDNLPTTNIEALACGTPVVCYDTGGSREITDESCGACVPKGDVAALAAAVKRCAAADKGIGALCVQRAQLFDRERCCEEYYRLYQELCRK